MHRESECWHTEDVQAYIITNLTDKFNIIDQESDGILLFRALSRRFLDLQTTTSKLEKLFLTIFSIIVEKFENHLPEELDEYIQKLWRIESGWKPEKFALSEVYKVNIIVYNTMPCSTL